MIIVLGPAGGGKSVLLQRLQGDFESKKDLDISSVPTIGTNIVYIYSTSTKQHSQKTTKKIITVQEIGGAMTEIWPDYLGQSTASGVIFVVDCCDFSHIGEATVGLQEVAKTMATDFKNGSAPRPLIVALNKVDALLSWSVEDIREHFLFVDDLKSELASKLNISWVETSSVSGHGLKELFNWICKCL